MGEPTDEEVRRVADAMRKEYRHQLPYLSLARIAISEMREIEREKPEFHIETVTTSSDGPLEVRVAKSSATMMDEARIPRG